MIKERERERERERAVMENQLPPFFHKKWRLPLVDLQANMWNTISLRWLDPTYSFPRISLIFYMLMIRMFALHNKEKNIYAIRLLF